MNDPKSPLRLGLVGCGRWGSLILRDLVSLGALVDVAVSDLDEAPRLLALGAHSVTAWIGDLSNSDGYVVATPTSTHADVISSLVPFGRPIFVEKPFTDDLKSAKDLVEEAPNLIFVMDKWRYHPGVISLRNLVKAGDLGDVTRISTTRIQNGMPHTDVDCRWILLPHDLAIALEIFGEIPKIQSATPRYRDNQFVGVSTEMWFSTGVQMISNIGIDAPSSIRTVIVDGTEASATLNDGWADEILVDSSRGGPAAKRRVPAVGELPLLAELRAFLSYLNGGPPPRSSAAEGLRSVQVISGLNKLI